MQSQTIYLIRHAHSWSNYKWLGAWSFLPLSPKGKSQLERLKAQQLCAVSKVYCSPYLRAKQTARAVFPENNAQVSRCLHEVNPSSKSLRQHQHEVQKFFEDVCKSRENTAIVAHKGILREILKTYFDVNEFSELRRKG
jgi:broad specificity phosphatase PhoE